MKLIHEQIAKNAAINPAKTALVDRQGEISYGELEAITASLARSLAAVGVKAGNAVAVYVPYAKEIVVGAISAWRAGGVFLPFDDTYPVERLDYMLENSEAAAILTLREQWSRKPLRFPEDKVIMMDEPIAADEAFFCPVSLSEDSPAMLLYTSGTTGRPKGVLHTHALLANILDWMNPQKGPAVTENSRGGVVTGFTFVATQVFLWGPLLMGGTVCIAPEAARKDLGYLDQFIREQRITHIFLPSSLGAVLAEDFDIRGVYVMVGGEKLRNFHAHITDNCLYHAYGCTETGVLMVKRVFGNEKRMLIGKPSEGTNARIVDEEMRTLPAGEAGELLISSPFMSHCYFKLPELSAEKWIMLDGSVWYRTGDRAIRTPDGDYGILGRTDNMAKLRGFRIETGEVEVQAVNAATRLGRTDIGDLVVALRNVNGTDHLVCYYEAERELHPKEIQEEISKYLAEYMVPDVWVRLDAFPRNANGKVLRKELPQPKRDCKQGVSGALDSEVLARLVYTPSDVLNPDTLIGPDDRFTDLGGTSLTAMKYTALLRQQGIKVTNAQVLQLNVLRRIAEAAEVNYEQLWSPKEYDDVQDDFATRGEHIQKVLPITPEQDEMLFEQIIHPDRANDRNVVFLQTDGLVSESDLREVLNIISDENEALRSAIVYRHVTTVQQVITDRKIPLEFMDAEQLGINEMRMLRDNLLHAPMDLQRDSMMRVVYLKAGRTQMLCVMTHRIAFGIAERRVYLARLMSLLEERYPNDTAIRGWREIFETSLSMNKAQVLSNRRETTKIGIKKEIPPEICVYSENDGPKVVFVHTANTGSSAYYRLAARIGDKVSFSVIEPFNLYHMDKAQYGIRNIAAKYVEILKHHQPKGPYLLGGWCYGGQVAQEMACQLEQAGEDVRLLVMLDSHAIASGELRAISKGMTAEINREYFETSPLFADLRESGMLEAMVTNAAYTVVDTVNHTPAFYHGDTLYFKPDQIPSGISEESRQYWMKMMEFEAGNYEQYCERDRLRIVHTPHEHDLMMDDASLDIIVPELMRAIESHTAEGVR